MKVDLHIHSTASDGDLPPREVVARARAGGLDVIAIADHDTAAGVPEAVMAAGEDVVVIPAIELSARHRDRDLHILGYFVDPAAPAMLAYASRARQAREDRVHAMIGRLSALNVSVDFTAVLEEAGPDAHTLARPHLARAMLAAGHVASVAEAFDRYIGDDGPAFVATDLLDVPGAIGLIHDAGGLAVWAHPPLPLLAALPDFVAAGLDGLECHRPRVGPADLNRLLNKARDHGLLVTGGSDWHGHWHGDLGTFHVGRGDVGAFLERGGI
ncbi:MAG TPA: PHP domain-containing protein [Longimicrobiales bacterium]|nr:PHP domain-containing protein [Longimicrobiales bacterium]